MSIDVHLMDDGGLDTLYEKKNLIQKELTNLNHLSQVDLTQEAKIQWVFDGDENIGFFHGTINRKKSQLAIRGVLRDGCGFMSRGVLRKNYGCIISLFL